jgi:hypothetical protein
LRDKADNFETQIINAFRKNYKLKEMSGYHTTSSEENFYVARPLAVTNQSCLRCHSTPAAAPKSLIDNYGKNNGFGWKLNEVVGIQIISVPVSR